MARKNPNVKPDCEQDSRRSLVHWIDMHPRTGWYCAVILTVNFILNLLDALDVDLFWFTR